MTTPIFEIWLDRNDLPGTVQIEVYQADAPGPKASLAIKHVPDRGDIPGLGINRYRTDAPGSMASFAMLPDWVRNDAMDTLAQAYIALMDRGHDFTTH